MAIICLGEVVVEGNPSALVEAMQGKVWEKLIDKQELDHYKQHFNVISTQLKAGQTQVHVFSEAKPDPSFAASKTTLEDVYFTRITERMGALSI